MLAERRILALEGCEEGRRVGGLFIEDALIEM